MVGKSGHPDKKSRNYGKSADDLQDRLDFVAALLALADTDKEKIPIPPGPLKAQFKLDWVKINELKVSGTIEEQQRNGQTKKIEIGITQDSLGRLLEIYLQKPIQENARKTIIQTALDCLRDLGIIKNVTKTQKARQYYWQFSLLLKNQTQKEENIQVIKDKWKEAFGNLPELKPIPQPTDLDKWQEICQQNVELQKQLTTNPFTNADGVTPQLDEIYVSLAIVERQPSKTLSRNQTEEKEAEKLIPIAEERFFEDVLRQGKSPISQGRKIAIIGEPGSGKTTRLQKIADWILEQDLGLPIWVSLADLTQATITQYIKEIWLTQTKSLTIDELTQHKERIWLLLDGLDEMTSRVETRHVSKLLGGWVPGARVVVTCRVNVWDADKNAFSGFDVFRNLEFNPKQVTNYIRRWFAAMGDVGTGESLEAKLAQSNNSRIKELIHNPLRLWMLCQIWRTGGGFLPETQAGLYAQFVKWVYRWKADEEILDQREAIDKALAQLAWAAMEQKDEVSRLRLPESWVLKVLGSRQIFKAVEKLGWLNRLERSPEAIWLFYHATFQEYFAALAVENWNDFLPRTHVNRPVEGKYRIFEPQWKQVILLWLGREYVKNEDVQNKEKEAFIRALVKFEEGWGEWNFEKVDRGFYEYRAYFLAAAGINEFKAFSPSLAADIVRQLVKWGFGYFKIEKQEWQTFLSPITEGARKAIPETIRRLAVVALNAIIENYPNEYIFLQDAALSLGKIDPGNPKAIAGLLELMRTTENQNTRWWLPWNLGEIGQGNIQAIAGLLELIGTTENQDTRWLAAESLRGIGQGNPQAIKGLLELIRTTENENIRWVTAESLREIGQGNPQAISGLREVIRTTENEEIRWLAAWSLGEIDPGNPEVIAGLREVIRTNENEDTHWRAAWSLGEIDPGNPEAIGALLELMRTTENKHTRSQAAESLGEIGQGNPQAIAGLLEVIQTTANEDTRRLAAESLGEIGQGNTQAIDGLRKVIRTTENEHTRLQAAWSLGKIDPGNPKAISTVVKVIRTTKNEHTSRRAALSLGEIGQGNPEEIDGLLQVIRTTENTDTRWQVALSLGEIGEGNPRAINGLLEVIGTTENEHTLRLAALSLQKIGQGNPEAIVGLLEVIHTTANEDTRRLAVESLGEIGQGNPEAIAGLLEVIRTTENEDIRWLAAESLGKIDPGNPQAINGLLKVIRTTENEDPLRRAAWKLGEIGQGNPEAINGLLQVIHTTENEDTRRLVAQSLEKIGQGNSPVIAALVKVIGTTENENTRRQAAQSLEKIDPGNPEAIAGLVQVIATTEDEDTQTQAAKGLEKILATPQQYTKVVSTLKYCLSGEVYQNDFDRFDKCYKLIWNCAENLPYPEFHEAWHNPLTTPHTQVTAQTQVGHNSTVDSLETQPIDICLQLQNLPIFCLDATILTDETEPSEIAQTLCQLIWDKALSDEDYPKEVTTASKLREQLKTLKLRQNLPKFPILITHCYPSSELIAFCRKLTNIVAIAWLTDEPLEAPLKGFPPNQPHLISAIQTWLEEI
ncbi:HEAT repeat domain-containing protein [Laspinema sp. D1]|uniref:HEAT repeat domain-containing protein n=1 Tax=Laspinema palackyanum D2a TaxID=2953684 RepID=A0ABT2MZA8_9CYAN|nr:HEAT repeat domain-containing protein [Laspinema sp. D2a]